MGELGFLGLDKPERYGGQGHRAHAIVLVAKTDPSAGYEGFTLFLVAIHVGAPGRAADRRRGIGGRRPSTCPTAATAICRSTGSSARGATCA